MFNFNDLERPVESVTSASLYKWHKHWYAVQRNFFSEQFQLLREKQIQDFVYLNGYKQVCLIKDNDAFKDGLCCDIVDDPGSADLTVITDQKFSRRSCTGIVRTINSLLLQTPELYVCLNRHYINIDNSYQDATLSEDYELAIAQWLKKSVTGKVVDLSLTYEDRGDYFTWVIPDRHFYIQR